VGEEIQQKSIAGKTKLPDQTEMKSRDVCLRSRGSTRIKPVDTHRMQKLKFSLKSTKIHTITEVTVFPPLFDWKIENMVHGSLNII
jgi:hypothetical protein